MIANMLLSIDWQCFAGFICAEAFILIFRSIERSPRDEDVLPAPRMDRIARNPHHAYEAGAGHIRFDNNQGDMT
jgi:hypothetical protein